MLSKLSNLLMALVFAGVLIGTFLEGPDSLGQVTPVDPKIRTEIAARRTPIKPSVRLFVPPRPRSYSTRTYSSRGRSVREGSRSYSSSRRSMNSGGYRSGK